MDGSPRLASFERIPDLMPLAFASGFTLMNVPSRCSGVPARTPTGKPRSPGRRCCSAEAKNPSMSM